VMVMRPDGSRQERLTTDQVSYSTPAVSPDGQTIAVASRAGGFWSIYLLDRFGQSRTKLVPGRLSLDGSPVWSPDGTKIAFRGALSGPYGDYGRIFVVNRDGTGLQQVTPETADFTTDDVAAWSPDGAQLVYSHSGVIWAVNADGSGAQSLGIAGFDPALSPNGQRITYEAYLNQALTIFIADRNGANARPLTTPVDGDSYARWSPDGGEIVFQRVVGHFSHLYKIAADGAGLTKLSTITASEYSASFSPLP
ncbi:MAG TPA: hypothetical protein VJO33_19450, partial [Gemmatimonadaceae bacterium]|nr:hypothetical protein [Gemmatimonadaceae bacterium]